jgi:hypothetical protein
MLPTIKPYCDRHPSAPMQFTEIVTDELKASMWLCTVEGCVRCYSRGHGYQNVGESESGTELNYFTCPKCPNSSAYISGQRGLTCDACGSSIFPG